MKINARAVLLGLAILATGAPTTSFRAVGDDDLVLQGPTSMGPRPKVIDLDCSHGWRADAQGQYGGVGFALHCQNGRARGRIAGASGTAWSVRIGAESESVGLDCFLTGDSPTVDVTCASAAHFTVR